MCLSNSASGTEQCLCLRALIECVFVIIPICGMLVLFDCLYNLFFLFILFTVRGSLPVLAVAGDCLSDKCSILLSDVTTLSACAGSDDFSIKRCALSAEVDTDGRFTIGTNRWRHRHKIIGFNGYPNFRRNICYMFSTLLCWYIGDLEVTSKMFVRNRSRQTYWGRFLFSCCCMMLNIRNGVISNIISIWGYLFWDIS